MSIPATIRFALRAMLPARSHRAPTVTWPKLHNPVRLVERSGDGDMRTSACRRELLGREDSPRRRDPPCIRRAAAAPPQLRPARTRWRLAAGTWAVCLVFSANADAQVNVERLRKGLDGNGVAGSVDASLTGRAGNSEGVVAGGAAQMQWLQGRHGELVYATGDYARLNKTTTISRSVFHARYSLQLMQRGYWELFAQQQTDRFRLLRSRELVGSGPRIAIIQGPQFELFLGTAYMLEYETINVQPGATDATNILAHRWSTYLSLSFLQDDRFSASTTTYIQPRFDRFADFRLLNETALVVEINKLLATKLSVSVRSDSAPPTGVVPTDVEVKNSLVVKF